MLFKYAYMTPIFWCLKILMSNYLTNFSIYRISENATGMLINFHKTEEIVLHRPRPSRWSLAQSLEGIEQVLSAKSFGVIFQCTFSFVYYVDYILEI